MSEQNRDGYVLNRTTEEYERLRQQAKLWEPSTRRVLETVGVRPGMRCLDVGCGVGDVMRLLGAMVGPTGSVTGLDIDLTLRDSLCATLRRDVEAQFHFIAGDLQKLTTIDGAPFDIVYMRFTLLHLQNPLPALRNLFDWVAPGGHLVLQDTDFRTMDLYPGDAAIDEYKRVVFGVFERAGLDSSIGHKLPVLMHRAGIGEPDGTDVAGLLLAPSLGAGAMLKAGYTAVLPAALQFQLTTQAQAQQFYDDLDRLGSDPQPRTGLSPLLMSAWKRKPAAV